MPTPYTGEVAIFGFTFAPPDWAFCNGAALDRDQYSALFAVIGTRYGNTTSSNFLLPNLNGRAPGGQGAGPGLSSRVVGGQFGQETVSLTTAQMPAHQHNLVSYGGSTGRTGGPVAGSGVATPATTRLFRNAPQTVTLNGAGLSPVGASQPHENMQPFLALNYSIALNGVFPTQA